MQQLHQPQCTQLQCDDAYCNATVVLPAPFGPPTTSSCGVSANPRPFFRRNANATERLNVTGIAKSGEQSRPRLTISGSWRDLSYCNERDWASCEESS